VLGRAGPLRSALQTRNPGELDAVCLGQGAKLGREPCVPVIKRTKRPADVHVRSEPLQGRDQALSA
jgi:hypothetical protein